MGIQIHGGMGFVEETGAAQFLRDVRITPIYEGTNGIQAMDLVGRKMMDGGEAAFRLLDEVQASAEAGPRHPARPGGRCLERRRSPARDDRMAAGPADERPLRRRRPLPARLRPRAGRRMPTCAPRMADACPPAARPRGDPPPDARISRPARPGPRRARRAFTTCRPKTSPRERPDGARGPAIRFPPTDARPRARRPRSPPASCGCACRCRWRWTM